MYHYSAHTNAFYPHDFLDAYKNAGTLPADLIAVDQSVFDEFTQSFSDKTRVAGSDGLPVWHLITISLEDLKAAKLSALKAWRDSAIADVHLIDINNHTYQIDQNALLRLSNELVVANALSYNDEDVLFDDYLDLNNQLTELKKLDVLALIQAKNEQIKNVRAQYNVLREEIMAAQTLEALTL